MKRVTYYPQVVLGVAFGWAVFFAEAALDIPSPNSDIIRRKESWALFGANILWTIAYDTIYAHQDVADDEAAGVKGMALVFRDTTKILASGLAAGQVILLVLCGIWGGFGGWVYYVGTVGGVAGAMGWFIWDVDLKVPESCGDWFRKQFWVVGGAYASGFVGEYVARVVSI